MAVVRAVRYIAICSTLHCHIGKVVHGLGDDHRAFRFPERNTTNGRRAAETCVLRGSGDGRPGPDRVCRLPQRLDRTKGQPQQGAGAGAGGAGEPASKGGSKTAPGLEQPAESADTTTPTTVKEYSFKPAEKLPPVKGTAAYKPLHDNTVRFALNVWAGWAPIVLANNGFKAGKEWTTADGNPFKVDLVLIDNPVQMRDAYAAGEVHIGWATLDMVPLFLESFVDAQGNPRDSRIMPRIYQQVDFSNGGDGVVVRENIKTVADLRGKKLVLAQNSPSHYFALNISVSGGVQPSEVQMVFTDDAFQAAAAFNAQKDIAGCVSWAPDIYNLAKARGNRMLVTTQEANHLIADVWFARADFARDNTAILEAIIRGIFDAMEAAEGQNRSGRRSPGSWPPVTTFPPPMP